MPSSVAEMVIELIDSGRLDDDLTNIRDALNKRLPIEVDFAHGSQIGHTTFLVGQRVRLRNIIRPAYLRGMTGKVVGVAVKNLKVQLDPQFVARASRFVDSRDGVMRCPPSLLEKE